MNTVNRRSALAIGLATASAALAWHHAHRHGANRQARGVKLLHIPFKGGAEEFKRCLVAIIAQPTPALGPRVNFRRTT